MTLETLFLVLRIYGAVAAFAAALIIWLYQRAIANPRFARFARIVWIVKLLTGIQRTGSIFALDFFSALNSVMVVSTTAAISTYIFVAVLIEYISLRRAKNAAHHSSDLNTLADRAFDILDYK
jgi:hypothetical protein